MRSVQIQLDVVRNLRFGMGALARLEKELGIKITDMNLETISFYDIVNLCYVGFKHEDKELTLDKTMDILDEYGNVEEIGNAIGKAIELSFGKQEGK